MRRHGPVIAHCTDSEDFPYTIKHRIFGFEYLKLNCSRHPKVMTLKPAAADGMRTVLH